MADGIEIGLKSCRGHLHMVALTIVKNRITFIREMLETLGEIELNEPFPLKRIKKLTLAKVIEWATYHRDDPVEASVTVPEVDPPISEWDTDFIMRNKSRLADLLNAANYLQMMDLRNMLCRYVADSTVGKNIEELRTLFGIVSNE